MSNARPARWRAGFLLSASLSICCAVCPSLSPAADFDDDYDVKVWEEIEAKLPAPPKDSSLIAFFVSASSANRFQVDGDSISVGADGVIRYTLVVTSASGVRNVSYEGIRCETAERRLYAFGRADGAWSKARGNMWVKIQNSSLNRQHAALFTEYFCPIGNPVADADEARKALLAGGHPSVPH
ncbi:CNP1-like family protein [Rhodocyclus gracilis]|uniref:CNP1-like uncharacterized domain-containing protein n=1 Tax=Rhodocyclus tenuis TaxID=1066 RepID=A0A6L5JY55_RHOTE|nr:CNP1-like family protein [Rhodocyclus gracilis]MQY52263.1 hypothetical protein [Rhodocyclus gracilis]